MALRSGHGNGAGVPRVEVLPADELPLGEPGPSHDARPDDREPNGRFRPGNSLAGVAGRANAGKGRLASRLGLTSVSAGSDFAPYKRAASTFRRTQCAELARTVGGGFCGPGPSSLVASAALQLAWSRYLSDRAASELDADLVVKASRLAEASRQSLLAAHELCAREAQARGRLNVDPHAALASALKLPGAP